MTVGVGMRVERRLLGVLPHAFDEIQALLIVDKVHGLVRHVDGHTLARVLFVFGLEHGMNEVLLQLFVGVVDEELLEAVVLEDFEAEDVEDADF